MQETNLCLHNGTIDFVQTAEGIARNNGGVYSYEYNLTDHLGNVGYTFDIYGGAVRRLAVGRLLCLWTEEVWQPHITEQKNDYDAMEA